jgi:two-component system, sensor histidine kinase
MIIAKSITHFVKYEQLKLQNHFLEMLTATISHDMRTPLNAIIGMGRNLEKYLQHEMGKRFHRVIINSAALLLFLVNDLLDLFRIKNGKFTKNEVQANFRKELSELIDIFQL